MGLVQVLGVSAEGQQEAKSLQPNKTNQNTLTNNYTPHRTWLTTSTSFYNTLSSLLLANYSFFSHSLVAPATRRVLADQHNAPKTSVKMYTDVNNPNTNSLYYNKLGHGWYLALGAL